MFRETLGENLIRFIGPFIFPFVGRYPQYRRYLLWIGTLICWLSLFGASYASTVSTFPPLNLYLFKKVHELVILQGVLYAIGGCTCFTSLIISKPTPLSSSLLALYILPPRMVHQPSRSRKRSHLRRYSRWRSRHPFGPTAPYLRIRYSKVLAYTIHLPTLYAGPPLTIHQRPSS